MKFLPGKIEVSDFIDARINQETKEEVLICGDIMFLMNPA